MEIVDNKTSSSPMVIKLDYSPEILEKLDKLNRSTLGEATKKLAMRRLIGSIKQCCICQALPEYEVIYYLEKATKIERYCQNCYNRKEELDRKFLDPNDYFVKVPSLREWKES